MKKNNISYPYLEELKDKWIVLGPDVRINMTAIYGKGKEPSVEMFYKVHYELCENALKAKIYKDMQKHQNDLTHLYVSSRKSGLTL
jgi:hypothetical protein